MIEIRNLKKEYKIVTPLKDVSVIVNELNNSVLT